MGERNLAHIFPQSSMNHQKSKEAIMIKYSLILSLISSPMLASQQSQQMPVRKNTDPVTELEFMRARAQVYQNNNQQQNVQTQEHMDAKPQQQQQKKGGFQFPKAEKFDLSQACPSPKLTSQQSQ